MAKKIYVGNMSYSTTEDSLRALFTPFGEVVSASLITDRYTGESKGFGFVEMAEDSAAMAAISGVNGKEIDGRQLRVNEAHDKPRNGGGGGQGGGGFNKRRF
jgi:RNA recognition motif-containing protein